MKDIHKISTKAPLGPVLEQLLDEYTALREHAEPTDEDKNHINRRVSHAVRQAIEVSFLGRDHSYICPCCGKELTPDAYDKEDGGDQVWDKDDVEYQNYLAVCEECGKKFYFTYRYIGALTEKEMRSLTKSAAASPFVKDEMDDMDPIEILKIIRAVKPETIKKANGIPVKYKKYKWPIATFADIVSGSDGTLFCQIRPAGSETDIVVPLDSIEKEELRNIVDAIR